jgi:hypothetical protein
MLVRSVTFDRLATSYHVLVFKCFSSVNGCLQTTVFGNFEAKRLLLEPNGLFAVAYGHTVGNVHRYLLFRSPARGCCC